MNEWEELKRRVADIVAAGDEFVRLVKEHNEAMERQHRETMGLIRTANENWKRVNTALNEVKYGQS